MIVKEHINEAIKHLTPRSKEEIEKNIPSFSDGVLFDLWNDALPFSEEERKWLNVIIKRKTKSSKIWFLQPS